MLPAEHGAARTVPRRRPVMALYPFARGPVLTVAGLVAALLMLISGRYGYLSDELYFLAAGKYYLDWGYMDQQPLVPLLAAGLDGLAPGSLLVLRLPALLVTVLGIIGTALIAREFGGDRRAQTLAGGAYPLSPWLLLSGHWLAAATMEPLQWITISWLVVRWTRLNRMGIRRDRLLLAVGLVAAVALQIKFQVALLCVALLVAAALAGPRVLLRRPLLWVGAAIPVLTSIPTVLWQAQHRWPALDMRTVVDDESDRLLLLPAALAYSGLAVGALLCCYGLWQLLRARELRDYRFLGWAVVGVAVFYLLFSGRPNYFAALYGPLFAAAAVGLQHRRPRARKPRWTWVVWPAYLLSALLPLALLPIYPLPLLARHPELASASRLYETGWPDLARTVTDAYRRLPPETRRRTAIVAESYYLAAALDVEGRRLGLPRSYSPHRGYWFFGRPPGNADVVLYAGSTRSLDRYFGTREELGTVRTHLDLENIPQGVSVTRYEHPSQPWHRLWPRLRTM